MSASEPAPVAPTARSLCDMKARTALSVSVCLPAHDEEATIGEIVAAIRHSLVERDRLVDEIVVLDDGSADRTAERAAEAGATYLIAPDFRADVVAWAVERELPVVPGALTPTEVAAAWAAGATAVKVFPVSAVGGPAYVKAVRAPLPEVPLMPTGGVGIDDIGAYLAAGAAAVGVGAPLLGDAGGPGGDLAALAARARRAVAAATGAAGEVK